MCAPPRTAAVTAAAVPHTRSLGGTSPSAVCRNDLRDGPKLSHLRHVIGVGGARETGVLGWEDLLAKAGSDFKAVDTQAEDPALIIYTSGTTGPPKGALKPHRIMLGNVPGFVHSLF
jgi:acyl-coenzyme A synthetase/AMP-(fatty) acid ligase